jgi:hypothetical protein
MKPLHGSDGDAEVRSYLFIVPDTLGGQIVALGFHFATCHQLGCGGEVMPKTEPVSPISSK